MLQLLLDRVLAHEAFPSLELAQKLVRSSFTFSEDLFPQLLANFLLNRLNRLLVLLHGAVPGGRLVLIGVETVDFAEGVEGISYLQALLLVLLQKAQQFVVLRAQLEDHIDANDDVLEVAIHEGLALPLVLHILSLPEVAGQVSDSVFPSSADTHALVELHAHIGEGSLPDVVLFEFPLNSGAESL